MRPMRSTDYNIRNEFSKVTVATRTSILARESRSDSHLCVRTEGCQLSRESHLWLDGLRN